MGMTAFYGSPASEEESLATIGRGLELGLNFLDTAWIYQDFESGATNEALVGKALAKFGREKFVLATKFGIKVGASGIATDSSRETIRAQLEQSLQRLNTPYIDLYYQHRPDPNTPIEDVVRSLKELVDEGKIKYIGLSECTPDELRRAHAIHPVTAIQMEWSLQTRDIEAQVVPTARELGVAIVAYSPLGRGFLSRTFKKVDDLDEKDWRRRQPRFKEHFDANEKAAAKLEELAAKHKCTPAQLALAWVHGRGDDVFPIPGTRRATRLEENIGALKIKLSPEECAELEAAVPEASGDRYEGMQGTFNTRL
jgi:aryl-alcohol dehydrogenase-like predicted oxidoreductase